MREDEIRIRIWHSSLLSAIPEFMKDESFIILVLENDWDTIEKELVDWVRMLTKNKREAKVFKKHFGQKVQRGDILKIHSPDVQSEEEFWTIYRRALKDKAILSLMGLDSNIHPFDIGDVQRIVKFLLSKVLPSARKLNHWRTPQLVIVCREGKSRSPAVRFIVEKILDVILSKREKECLSKEDLEKEWKEWKGRNPEANEYIFKVFVENLEKVNEMIC